MNTCKNCGKENAAGAVFCRFCGIKFGSAPAAVCNPFDHAAPKPYGWKTDEFQTQNEARPTMHLPAEQGTAPFQPYQPAPLTHQPMYVAGNFQCPRCQSRFQPRMERRISTSGWVTFALLLVFFFPLFWIGLLIKEDVPVCQSCNLKLGTA